MYTLLLSVLISSLSLSVYAKESKAEFTEELAPTRAQQEASLYVARSLSLNHYRKQHIDKTLSEKVYENYLDSLDPSRIYFLSEDITEFEIYRFRLDSALKTGQLDPAFRIYNRYQTRVITRLNKQIEFLNTKLNTLDFTKDEYILTDRSEVDWATSETELDNIWRKRTKNTALSQKLDGKTNEEIKESLLKRYQNQLKRTLQVRSEDAFSAYMNAFTTLYDPHTTYFSPRSSENFNINMSLSLEGIGAVLQADNEFTKVVRLVAGGPAQKQGKLHSADRIVGVAQGEKGDMVEVIGWRLDEVVELIRGPKHSKVRLKVIPHTAKLDTDTIEIKIVRDKVKLEEQAAASSVLDIERDGKNHRIGVIDIPTFYADFKAMQEGDPNYKSTTRDTLKLLKEMQAEQALDGLVIDLRGNGGGSLDEANQLTGLFIHEGPTVQIRGANHRIEVLDDPDPKLMYDGPLIVLVDRLSASASEIFAGAIQDYGRGIVMGTPTFGKGTVQAVRPLNHGQLKITQAKFYRISGASTQHKGVVPDIILPDTIDTSKVGEDALDHALEWDSIASAKFSKVGALSPLSQKLAESHITRITQHPEYVLLLEEIELLESQRGIEKVTINEQKRKTEDEAFDKARLDLLNKRRRLEQKPEFESLQAWRDSEDEKPIETDKAQEPDFIVEESAEVLLDFISLQQVSANALANAL
ncbi:peptidase S41 [Oleiphilus sp. HI0081]|nr:peptidase S41 [Oleiphilus sp. HI0081]